MAHDSATSALAGTRDWERLASVLAPTVAINYASVNDYRNDALPAADFVKMVSDQGFLGDLDLDTQHLLGACRLRKLSAEEIHGQWQIRVAHQRYRSGAAAPESGTPRTAKTKRGERTVLLTGHSHAVITHIYKLIDGQWKWGGIITDIRWNEDGFDQMFTGFEAGKPPE